MNASKIERHYGVAVAWTGNDGAGTESYRSYRRDHVIEVAGKAPIQGSSDPVFRGDPSRYNPAELLEKGGIELFRSSSRLRTGREVARAR